MGDLSVERRTLPRLKVEISARIVVSIPAAVLDLSEGGCQIRLTQPIDLPQRFIIEFVDKAYLCERCWTKGAHSGVKFLDLCSSAQRRARRLLLPHG